MLKPRALLARQQEHQVDVGEWRQFTATVTAYCRDRHSISADSIGINVRVGEVVDAANQLVDEKGIGLNSLGPPHSPLEPPADLRNSAIKSRLEDLQNVGPRPRARSAPPCLLLEFDQQRPTID